MALPGSHHRVYMVLGRRFLALGLLGLVLTWASGCAVPQPRGQGIYQYVTEPTTKAGYHLYLPMDYVRNNGRHPNPRMKGWPLVMTFHGMKPYDNALPQEREWEKEADIYGYVVCAPELNTSDSFMEYPLTREHSYVLRDKENVIAIMEHVFQTTNSDRKKVLATSWSCGGYLAHYFPNRFPDRFAAIAVRLSNFSAALLTEATVPLYKDRVPVAIFIGDGDFAACKTESQDAVAWYEARKFKTVRGKMIDNMGHSRIPQTAAAFFAEQIGLEPLHPEDAARTVAQVQMTDYYPPPTLLAQFAPPSSLGRPPTALAYNEPASRRNSPTTPPVPPKTTPSAGPGRSDSASAQSAFTGSSAGRDYPTGRSPAYETVASRNRTEPPASPPIRQERPAPQPAAKPPAPQSTPPRNDSQQSTQLASAAREPKSSPPPATRTNPPPSSAVKQVAQKDAASKPPQAEQPKPWKASEPPMPMYAGRPVSRNEALRNAAAREANQREAADRSSGQYGVTPSSGRMPGTAAARPSQPASASRAFSSQTRANRVNVQLNGPAVGTSPHFIQYSVDLPREKLEGADFLWLDNGVWLNDEPRGHKILTSPGHHNISVIVVTRDDVEYRGNATVQVLEPGPGSAAY